MARTEDRTSLETVVGRKRGRQNGLDVLGQTGSIADKQRKISSDNNDSDTSDEEVILAGGWGRRATPHKRRNSG